MPNNTLCRIYRHSRKVGRGWYTKGNWDLPRIKQSNGTTGNKVVLRDKNLSSKTILRLYICTTQL